MLGTLIGSYYRGYDVVLVKDATATTSPEGGFENVCWNVGNVSLCVNVMQSIRTDLIYYASLGPSLLLLQSYGFVTDSTRIVHGLQQC